MRPAWRRPARSAGPIEGSWSPRAHLSIHRLHSLDHLYPACMEPRSHEWYTADKQIALSRLQKALWQAHIGLLRKAAVSPTLNWRARLLSSFRVS
jgi:hypothetical protein